MLFLPIRLLLRHCDKNLRDLRSRNLLKDRRRGVLSNLRRDCGKRRSDFGDVNVRLLREWQVRVTLHEQLRVMLSFDIFHWGHERLRHLWVWHLLL